MINISDLQNVDITLRILFRPREESLPHIYANIGTDYDERILPSITTEVLKAVVVSPPLLLNVCAHILLFTRRPSLMPVSSSHRERSSHKRSMNC